MTELSSRAAAEGPTRPLSAYELRVRRWHFGRLALVLRPEGDAIRISLEFPREGPPTTDLAGLDPILSNNVGTEAKPVQLHQLVRSAHLFRAEDNAELIRACALAARDWTSYWALRPELAQSLSTRVGAPFFVEGLIVHPAETAMWVGHRPPHTDAAPFMPAHLTRVRYPHDQRPALEAPRSTAKSTVASPAPIPSPHLFMSLPSAVGSGDALTKSTGELASPKEIEMSNNNNNRNTNNTHPAAEGLGLSAKVADAAYDTLRVGVEAGKQVATQVMSRGASDGLAALARNYLGASEGAALESMVRIGAPMAALLLSQLAASSNNETLRKLGTTLALPAQSVMTGSMSVIGERAVRSGAAAASGALGELKQLAAVYLGGGALSAGAPAPADLSRALPERVEVQQLKARMDGIEGALQELLRRTSK